MKRLLAALFLFLQVSLLPAQQFFTAVPKYLTPGFRGQANTEFSHWDVFYNANGGINYPDMAAPNGTGGFASASGGVVPPDSSPDDPYAFWNTANPTLSQTLDNNQFIIGPGTTGNIYSFSGASAFEVADTTPYSPGLGTVVLQWQTDGTLIDLSTLKLVYNNGAGDVELAATNLITEYKSSGASFGGLTNRTAAQWNLNGLNINDYKIVFASDGSSTSFQELLLDTSKTYSEVAPSARTWDAGGADAKWSTAANWSGDSVTVTGGNVRFSAGTGAIVDSAREIGELQLNAPSGFVLGSSGGAILKINTGITADPVSTSSYTISAPVNMGAYNLINLNDKTTLTVSGVISGATGYYKEGAGTLLLTGNNTFTGGVTVAGGKAIISGTNAYTGATAVTSGALILRGNAPASSAGTLGNASSNVEIGLDEATYGVQDEAALLVEGDYTVGRNISMITGANPKAVGATNTTNGATYSGSVTLAASASNVHFRAENAADKVTFAGAITGGGTSKTVIKDGAGTVVFSGVNKTYNSATTVSAGNLVIATGTSMTGNGAMTVASSARLTVNGSMTGNGIVTVASGAQLTVNGTLGGSGALVLTGGTIGGSGTVNKAMTIDTGDILSPGNSPGTLNTAAQTWGVGGTLLWEMNDIDAGQGTGWDFLNATGALAITSTPLNKFTLKVTSLNQLNAPGLVNDFNQAGNGSWKILTASGGITGFDAGKFVFDTSLFQNSFSGSWSVSQTGNDLFINYTAIPEPSTYALLGLGGMALWFVRRRRQAAATS